MNALCAMMGIRDAPNGSCCVRRKVAATATTTTTAPESEPWPKATNAQRFDAVAAAAAAAGARAQRNEAGLFVQSYRVVGVVVSVVVVVAVALILAHISSHPSR